MIDASRDSGSHEMVHARNLLGVTGRKIGMEERIEKQQRV